MPKNVNIEKQFEDNVERLFWGIIIVAFLGGVLSIPKTIIDWVIQLLVSSIIGAIFSYLSGTIVQGFSGHLLEKLSLTITIRDYKFSITGFALATWIVQRWLFNA